MEAMVHLLRKISVKTVLPNLILDRFPPLTQYLLLGNGHSEYLDTRHDSGDALRRIRTAGSISISPELFEKIYLSPQNRVHGDLRKTFGNPTPLYVSRLLCHFSLWTTR